MLQWLIFTFLPILDLTLGTDVSFSMFDTYGRDRDFNSILASFLACISLRRLGSEYRRHVRTGIRGRLRRCYETCCGHDFGGFDGYKDTETFEALYRELQSHKCSPKCFRQENKCDVGAPWNRDICERLEVEFRREMQHLRKEKGCLGAVR